MKQKFVYGAIAVVVGISVFVLGWKGSQVFHKKPDSGIEKCSTFLTYENATYDYSVLLPCYWKAYSEYDGSVIASSPDKFPSNPLIMTGEPGVLNFQIEVIENTTIDFFTKSFLQNATKDGSKYFLGEGVTYLLQGGKNVIKVYSSDKSYIHNDEIFDSLKESVTPLETKTYFEVKELGFRISVDSSIIGDLTYKVEDGSVAIFSTKRLNSISKYCERDGVGAISKIGGTPSAPERGDPIYYEGHLSDIRQFDEFFLLWNGPQASCMVTQKGLELESLAIRAVLGGFENVSLIK